MMPELPAMAQALLDTAIYPEKPSAVELVQTQMSFVFLTDDYVYKVKKPVDLGYLDYTTLEKRHHFCQQEVKLNLRLCPDIYLGVVPITREDGGFAINGGGETVEYAVKMRRLPKSAMMDVMLEKDQVSAEMLSRVARRLAEFHAKAETGPAISIFGQPASIARNTDENFTQTEKYIGNTISPDLYRHLRTYTDGFIQDNAQTFERRVVEGRIRDCHGDLRAAHICFTNGIRIYDCIEFNDRFRCCDVALEIAFLAMDLDHRGRADLSRHFVNAYVAHSRDESLKGLLKFYKGYRAYVRGKVASFQLDDPYIAEAEKREARNSAVDYFSLADACTWARPFLLITVGLVGTGKSALARALARRFGLEMISSDTTRKKLASIPPTERHFDAFESGLYSAEFTRRTYDTLFARAGQVLNDGGHVILDASFIRSEERLRARELAEKSDASFMVIECQLDDDAIRERLSQRRQEKSASDGRPEILESQKQRFQPVMEASSQEHVVINTSIPVDQLVEAIAPRVSERGRQPDQGAKAMPDQLGRGN